MIRRFVLARLYLLAHRLPLIRHLNARLDNDGDGTVIEAALTARALGLGEHSGRHAPFLRSIRRALDYDLVGLAESDDPYAGCCRHSQNASPSDYLRASAARSGHLSIP